MLLDELFQRDLERSLVESAKDTLHLGGFDVIISPHVAERAQERGVPAYLINTLLSRLKRIKRAIKDIDPHEKFSVLDTQTGVAMGMRRSSQNPNGLLFNTVFIYDERPMSGPVIKIR